MSGLAWWRARKLLRTSPDIPFAFAHIPRSISISQSKRGGHTMSHSFFMPANVSLGWFFGFDALSEQILLKKLQKVLFKGGAQWLQVVPKNFLELTWPYHLLLQTSLGPMPSPKANGEVPRRLIHFLLSQTRLYGHFLDLIPKLRSSASKPLFEWVTSLHLQSAEKIF